MCVNPENLILRRREGGSGGLLFPVTGLQSSGLPEELFLHWKVPPRPPMSGCKAMSLALTGRNE
jgi:hypothetical protein